MLLLELLPSASLLFGIAFRIFLVEILVIVFCQIKWLGVFNLGYDRIIENSAVGQFLP